MGFRKQYARSRKLALSSMPPNGRYGASLSAESRGSALMVVPIAPPFMATQIMTAKMNNVDPLAWLTQTLERIAKFLASSGKRPDSDASQETEKTIVVERPPSFCLVISFESSRKGVPDFYRSNTLQRCRAVSC